MYRYMLESGSDDTIFLNVVCNLSLCHSKFMLASLHTRWVALMIQLEQQQHKEFVCGRVVADTNYLYPARWGWIKNYFVLLDLFW